MHGDYVKDCGAHHFCPSAWPPVHRYVNEETSNHPFISFYSSCVHSSETLSRQILEDGLWLGNVAYLSRWRRWDCQPLRALSYPSGSLRHKNNKISCWTKISLSASISNHKKFSMYTYMVQPLF